METFSYLHILFSPSSTKFLAKTIFFWVTLLALFNNNDYISSSIYRT